MNRKPKNMEVAMTSFHVQDGPAFRFEPTGEIIGGQSWAEYRAIERMNGSTLVHGLTSMKHLKAAITDGGCEETNSMRLGSGIHALLLEPEQFESRFVIVPDFHLDKENTSGTGKNIKESTSKATNYCKAKLAEFTEQNQGRDQLTKDQYYNALTAIDSIRAHHEAPKYLENCETEQTVIGEIEGVPFKCRLDLLGDEITDLKATNNCDPTLFGTGFARFRYQMKLAIQRELVFQTTGRIKNVVVIAQETMGVFDTVVFPVPEAVLDHGMDQVRSVIAKYKAASASGIWYGRDGGNPTMDLRFPNWAMPDDDLEGFDDE